MRECRAPPGAPISEAFVTSPSPAPEHGRPQPPAGYVTVPRGGAEPGRGGLRLAFYWRV